MSDVRIGLSRWTYKPWRGELYRQGLPQKQELGDAASILRSIEINGTFYSMQRSDNFAQWAEATPDDFVLAAKGPRYLTHMLKLRSAEAPLGNFFASGNMRRGTERVLVIEEDAQVRASVVEQLKSLGYAVVEGRNGEEGLAALEESRGAFNLLLTDVVMPGKIGGKALADEAARRWPRIAIMFMSGYTEHAIIHQGRLDPGVRLLTKPFRKHDLAAMVRKTRDESGS